MEKKRQYYIWQYKLEELSEVEGKLVLDLKVDDAVTTSETLMLYILNEKIRGRKYDANVKFTTENGKRIRDKKNAAPIITIETGRSKNKEQIEKLEKLLKEGFYIDKPKGHFVFIDNVLSGSHNKECRQMFVMEEYLDKLKEHISLGMEPSKCTVSKNLTRNALTTTDVFLVPVDMKGLGICIIPDCEVPFYEDVNMIKPYTRTPEEEKQYSELMASIEADKEYYKKAKDGVALVNSEECTLEVLDKKDRKKGTYKTVKQWKEKGLKVKEEELQNPKARLYIEDKSKYYPVYIEEQTEEISEEEKTREIPITEWSTGLQLVTDQNHKCMENVFDGMGLVSKELGEKFQEFLKVDYPITGYQLRLPSIKGFFPVVDFKAYYRKHNIDCIYDMWGQPHKVDEIDILTTESTFKAKLQVTGLKEDGSEKKEWLFKSIDEYKDFN